MRIEETNQILKESSLHRTEVKEPERNHRWNKVWTELDRQSARALSVVRQNRVPFGLTAIAAALATGTALVLRNRRPRKFAGFRF